ncbi:hypothetical protein [Halomonas phage vB_HmeY_H4907]|nr:hypothetical protein [Halomonas phage vB_HmeY_H4907]
MHYPPDYLDTFEMRNIGKQARQFAALVEC